MSIVKNDSSTAIMAHNSSTWESAQNDSESCFKEYIDKWEKEFEIEESATEIERYFLEPLEKRENFDVLKWWENNCEIQCS